MKNIFKTAQKGVTLLELVVVVAIVGILAGVGVAAYRNYSASATREQTNSNAQLVYNGVAQARAIGTTTQVAALVAALPVGAVTLTRANLIVAAIAGPLGTNNQFIFETGYQLPTSSVMPAGWSIASAGVLPVPPAAP